MWRACKAPSSVQWYSKLHTLVFSMCFLPCGVRVRPLPCSVVHQNCTLSCSVCFFSPFFSYQPHTRPRVSEKQKKPPVRSILSQLFSVSKLSDDQRHSICRCGNMCVLLMKDIATTSPTSSAVFLPFVEYVFWSCHSKEHRHTNTLPCPAFSEFEFIYPVQ